MAESNPVVSEMNSRPPSSPLEWIKHLTLTQLRKSLDRQLSTAGPTLRLRLWHFKEAKANGLEFRDLSGSEEEDTDHRVEESRRESGNDTPVVEYPFATGGKLPHMPP